MINIITFLYKMFSESGTKTATSPALPASGVIEIRKKNEVMISRINRFARNRPTYHMRTPLPQF